MELEYECNKERETPWPCKYCKVPDVWYTSDETFDGAYDRYHYHCHACGARWLVVAEFD